MLDMDYLSPEGHTHRIQVNPGTWQELNKYYVVKHTRILPEECVKEYMYQCYNRKGIFYFIFDIYSNHWIYIVYQSIS